jgi:hypothetical protein
VHLGGIGNSCLFLFMNMEKNLHQCVFVSKTTYDIGCVPLCQSLNASLSARPADDVHYSEILEVDSVAASIAANSAKLLLVTRD